MSDLTEFVRARLDEKAEKAEAARHGGDGVWLQEYPDTSPGMITDSAGGLVVYDDSQTSFEQAAHMVLHHPARVLAEVEAKREVVRLAVQARRNADLPEAEFAAGPSGVTYFVNGFAAAMEHAVQLFAQAYSGHPDYRPEWAPEASST